VALGALEHVGLERAPEQGGASRCRSDRLVPVGTNR
jgi:hypothetical protein